MRRLNATLMLLSFNQERLGGLVRVLEWCWGCDGANAEGVPKGSPNCETTVPRQLEGIGVTSGTYTLLSFPFILTYMTKTHESSDMLANAMILS